MKRSVYVLWAVLLLLVAVCTLAACGGNDGSDDTTAPVTTAPVTTAPVTTAPVTTAPVTTAPVTTAPVTTAPATSAPVTTVPVTTAPKPQGTELSSVAMETDGDTLYASVPNATESFSFLRDIAVAQGASYIVARDIYCEQVVHSKTVPLSVGNNTFYILVTNGNEMKLYTAKVRRRPMYTVSFDTNGGAPAEAQIVEEGSIFVAPTPSRNGYTFLSWDYDFSTPITQGFTAKASWSANTDTPYKVEHYLQNVGDNGYTLEETELHYGTTDTTVHAVAKVLTHFTFDATSSLVSDNLCGDGSLVLKCYYTRKTYTVKNGSTLYGTSTEGTHRYGAQVYLAATPYPGCDFLGWYAGETLLSIETKLSMAIEGEITAKFAPKESLSPFEYTISSNSCRITGVKNSNIRSLSIPAGVTSIGSSAFEGCSSLTSVTIPAGVTSIGSSAFEGCSSLTEVAIPDSVTSIGNDAFSGCSALTSVTIPASVTSIGGSAFEDCSKLTIYYDATKTPSGWSSSWNSSNRPVVWGCKFGETSDGIFWLKTSNGVQILRYSGCTTNLTVPATIDGSTVTRIWSGAFYNCSSLESITLPFVGASKDGTSNTRFDYIFGGGVPTSLKTVVITGGTSIGNWAFWSCSSLTSVTIGNGVISIGGGAFEDCTSLTSVTIPTSVTSIGNGAFRGCSSLTSVTIGNGVKSIGNEAFLGCSSLTSVHITDLAAWCGISFKNSLATAANPLCYAENLYLNGTLVTDLVIPSSVTSIGSYAFYNCSSLTSVTIPAGVTSIGNDAFSGCSALTSVTIPDSVTSIGYYAFSGCSALTSVTIPASVTSIGSWAFSGCSSLTSVTIPASVTSIGNYAFYNCSKLTIYCEAASKPSGWDSDWNYSACPVVWDCRNNEVANDGLIYATINGLRYALKDGVATVAAQPSNITTANIPATVTYKGSTYAVTSIGNYAFYYCSSLKSVTIPAGVTSIGSYAFYNCSSLTSVTIPDSVTSIGSSAFSGCTSLTSVTIPASVTSIGNYAFYYCSSLKSVTIPAGVTSIGSYAFYNCSSLTSVTIPDSVTSIGSRAFYNCSSLTIYCEATKKPSGWDYDWNYNACPVVWGYKGN